MIKLYDRLLSRCQTINQVNRVHISLADKLTALELYQLHRKLRLQTFRCFKFIPSSFQPHKIKLKLHGLKEVRKLIEMADNSGKKKPEPFFRHRIKNNIRMFSSSDHPTEKKTLVIAFAGNWNRLMIPISSFLQHISAKKYDVLLLNDPNKKGFRNGLPGIATNFEDLMVEIDRLVDKHAYKSVASIGTSAGGLPAMWAALILQLDKGVSLGGGGPAASKWQQTGPNNDSETLTKFFSQSNASNILYIYSDDYELDKSNAHGLAKIIPIHTLAIHSKTEDINIGHNVLLPFLKQATLTPFLDNLLDPTISGYDNKPADTGSKIWI